MQCTLILTHPGGSHKDEFLACCLLAAASGAPIERREPDPEDLRNPLTAVVDVGGEHDPTCLNFDHHQFPKDHPPLCALSLVLQHLNLYEDARAFCDWLEPAEWFDTRGPVATSQWLGVSRDTLAKLNSPLDLTLLRRFAQCSRLSPGEPLWEIMRWIGEDLTDTITSLRERLHDIARHSEIWEIERPGDSLRTLFLARTEPLAEEPSAGIGRYVESLPEEQKAAGLIYPDRRGGGYTLTRFQDDPRLDFTRLSSCGDVHFAHPRGFVAKTSATRPERLRELMGLAWL